MGAWGIKQFENDDASDFVYDVEKSDASLIVNTLRSVADFPEDDYMQLPEASCGLAAAEVVAAAKGNPASDFPETLLLWVNNNRADLIPLTGLAQESIKRILKNSELLETFREGDELESWLTTVADLEARLV